MKNEKSTLEKEIEDYLVSEVATYGGMCLKLRPDQGRGFPDRTIFMPYGWTAVVECKRPRGGLIARHQDEWRKRFVKMRFLHFYVETKTDVDGLLHVYHSWLIKTKRLDGHD